jgi:hypothetical protein
VEVVEVVELLLFPYILIEQEQVVQAWLKEEQEPGLE